MRGLPIVAHITSVHKPSDNRIYNKECRTLSAAGYTVVLIAPGEQDDLREGILIKAIPPSTSRLMRMTRTVWHAYRAALDSEARICHLHDPELLTIGLLLRLQGRVVIFDAHEDVVQDLLTKPYLGRWAQRVLSVIFAGLLWMIGGALTGFVAATPAIARRFPNRKTVLVCNYPYVDELQQPPSCAKLPRAVYIGSISRIRGIFEMIKALESSELPQAASLLLVGEFESQRLFQDAQALPGWGKVHFLTWQPRQNLAQLLAESSVGLVLFHPVQAHLEAMPNKLFEYMSAGLPIIVSNFPMWKALIESTGCGLSVDPLNPHAIATAIALILRNPDKAKLMGEAGRRAVITTYNWQPEGARLLEFYETARCLVQKATSVSRNTI